MRLAALALAAGCVGCAAGADECRSMNWYQLGYSDGWGAHPRQIEGLVRQCARHGVAAERADYLEGWGAGDAARRRKAAPGG